MLLVSFTGWILFRLNFIWIYFSMVFCRLLIRIRVILNNSKKWLSEILWHILTTEACSMYIMSKISLKLPRISRVTMEWSSNRINSIRVVQSDDKSDRLKLGLGLASSAARAPVHEHCIIVCRSYAEHASDCRRQSYLYIILNMMRCYIIKAV